MTIFQRSKYNPILGPLQEHAWESQATFNGCPIVDNGKTHLVYRAVSNQHVSSIGYAVSAKGIHFTNRKQLITPEQEWEKYGCEDPRVTKLNKKFFIFYTALSTYPFNADGIKIAVAITKDFKTIEEKHLVTPFNAKAMVLFPEKIKGKIAALLTVNTDRPPSHVCIAFFDKEEDIWSPEYWKKWYASLDTHIVHLKRDPRDHLEVGAPPVKTKKGWLFFYSYIENYFSPPPTFGIEAALLDLKHPDRILERTGKAIMVPEADYERRGNVANIVFPTGCLMAGNTITLYYGAADTTCSTATARFDALYKELSKPEAQIFTFTRFAGNPIIKPDPAHSWESKATFNPAVLFLKNRIHILYRAMSADNTSVIGYAASKDGCHIDTRLPQPVYVPREDFEQKLVAGGNSGCEDPRITKIGSKLFMCYTAYNGKDTPRVALTSISVQDFLNKKWNWKKPVLISPPAIDDKDAALFPEKIKGKYAVLHRIGVSIWIDFVNDLKFNGTKWIGGEILMNPRTGHRDSRKIGIAGPPIKTKHGWLLLYHGISKKEDHHYHLRAALLDLRDPRKVLVRTQHPIFEPELPYEKEGQVANVVFSCGSAVIKDELLVYYGAADQVIGVASIQLSDILKKLLKEKRLTA
ncbi:MAG: hypothetical protein U1A25_01900 [Candidatus Sungbacteria bacterium]|nr:hypothetical protein [bacterium]MDZ4260394.1 hypothetical protein [Candidatus Sungbacteria bacterium]